MTQKNLLLSIAFVEGASVMAVELLGAKMIAPFFGSSLYVWAAVLGVTLLSLMSGYYLGGYLSAKDEKKEKVYWILLGASVLMALMPYTSHWIMSQTIDMSVQAGATISLMIFMMPSLIGMGMSSPMIINMLNTDVDESGKTAGKVYAISTFGGIIGTFIIGFYLLPEYGVKSPCFLFAILLAILPLVTLVRKKKIKSLAVLLPFLIVLKLNSSVEYKSSANARVIYDSEGVLGQIKIVDMPFYTISRGVKKGRVLLVNNTAQSIGDRENLSRDLWDYSYYFPSTVSTFPKGSKALLMGLGGGAVYHHFNRLGFETDVVELDQRIKDVAIEWFGVDKKANIIVDDARRYLNVCEKKYDVILFDLFLNETPPSHALTKESFERAQKLLTENGVILINFYGYITGEKGRAARSVYKTLKASGLNCKILPTPGKEEHRNLIFIAGKKLPNLNENSYKLDDLPRLELLEEQLIDVEKLNTNDALVLVDEKPILEKMYVNAALDWRRVSIEYNLKRLQKEGVL